MEGTLIVTTQKGGPIDYFSLALGSGLEGYEVIRAMGLSMTHESYTEINLGKRTVYQAGGQLSKVQRLLCNKWVKPLPIGDSIAYEGYNLRERLASLTSHEVLITTDIVRFFDNIGYYLVKATMENIYEESSARILASIFTMTSKSGRRFLPQGGVASPFVANRVAALVIDPVVRACLPPGATYMRYCDNLLIGCSEDDSPGALIMGLRSVIASTGFRLHKTSVKRKHQRQKALGLVLNEVVNVPRKYVDAVRATLNNVVASSWEEQAGTTPVGLFKARTLGKARYVMDNSTTARSGRVRNLYEKLT